MFVCCPAQGWTVHLDRDGQEYFHNVGTQQSTYEHPLDQHYKQVSGWMLPHWTNLQDACTCRLVQARHQYKIIWYRQGNSTELSAASKADC